MKRILIIDDEVAVSSVFETALKHSGYEVKIASDGKSGIALAQSDGFDLILLDQMMPDMNGNDVLKTLKSDEKTKSMKVAMLTNFSHDALVKEALVAGAEDYIKKYEISPDDLVTKVKALVGE